MANLARMYLVETLDLLFADDELLIEWEDILYEQSL